MCFPVQPNAMMQFVGAETGSSSSKVTREWTAGGRALMICGRRVFQLLSVRNIS